MKQYLPKQLLTRLIAIAGVFFIPTVAHSQEAIPCFMTDDNGNVIDLGELCGLGTPGNGRLQVPIKRRESNIPVVDVTFNGTKTFEMLFDTGASGVAITSQMATALGVKPEGKGISETAGGTVEVAFGRVNSVAAGGVEAKNIVVSINEFLDIGLLGQGFFGSYDVTIREDVIEFSPR
ncbi:MAG: aspartyl protease [Symploca sp. SIO1B1]|nr:aspartyl protease [Symploca sp. SIO1A3]NER92372.1 aspartyl protease [Symploca sp. SIO1B1]